MSNAPFARRALTLVTLVAMSVITACASSSSESPLVGPRDASREPDRGMNTADADAQTEDATARGPADAGDAGGDSGGACVSPPPGVYTLKMTRTAGDALRCVPYEERTVDLTPEGIADAASTPPPFDAGGVDASSCSTVVGGPGPGCTVRVTCDDFTTTFVETLDPKTLAGSQRFTIVRPDGGVVLDCTWAVAYVE